MGSAATEAATGTVHMVYGPSGAGKTAYSMALAKRLPGIHFPIDRWMQDLFGPDLPEDLSYGWVKQRVARCEALIWANAAELLALGLDAVLDFGFMQRADRERIAGLVSAAGFTLERHYLFADVQLRRERVAARNIEQGPTFSMPVPPEMFEFAEGQFEYPSEEEQALGAVIQTP